MAPIMSLGTEALGGRQTRTPQLAQLGLWSLEERRHRADLLEVFRMHKGLSLTTFSQFFILSSVNNTRGHSAKIQKNHCSLDIRRHFFSQRVVNRWNCLPQHVIDSASINIFKNGLHKMRRDFDGLLYGLTGPPGPMASHVLKILRTGAAAPGKLPGKLRRRKMSL